MTSPPSAPRPVVVAVVAGVVWCFAIGCKCCYPINTLEEVSLERLRLESALRGGSR
jgi:hypothetical protein